MSSNELMTRLLAEVIANELEDSAHRPEINSDAAAKADLSHFSEFLTDLPEDFRRYLAMPPEAESLVGSPLGMAQDMYSAKYTMLLRTVCRRFTEAAIKNIDWDELVFLASRARQVQLRKFLYEAGEEKSSSSDSP